MRNNLNKNKENFNLVELYNKIAETQKSYFEGYLVTWRNALMKSKKTHYTSKFVKTKIAVIMRKNGRFRVIG